jgi:hypothetical protein
MLVSFENKRCAHAASYGAATSLFCYQTFTAITTMLYYVLNDRNFSDVLFCVLSYPGINSIFCNLMLLPMICNGYQM